MIIGKHKNTIYAANSTQFQNALNAAQPGDHIILQNGVTYSRSGGFSIRADGMSDNPIMIRGTGDPTAYSSAPKITSNLSITGDHVWLYRLYFEKSQVAVDGADYTLIQRSWFRLYPNHSLQITHGSDFGQVEYCYFEGPSTNNGGLRLINAASGSVQNHWQIRYDHFKNVPKSTVPGKQAYGAAMRIGEGYLSGAQNYNWLVEHCLFEDIGTPEIISVKSSQNTIRYSTFLDSQRVVFRYGDRNKMHGIWMEDSVGASVRGMDNEINGIKLVNSGKIDVFSGNVQAEDSGKLGQGKRPNAEQTWIAGYDGAGGIQVGVDNSEVYSIPARDTVLEGVPSSKITYGQYEDNTTNPAANPNTPVFTPFKLTASDVGPNTQ